VSDFDAECSRKTVEPRVTRNGTIRNTDSFFKDDNVETRKISLTPNILRDDGSAPRPDVVRERASFESDKTDKFKEDKKKEKKSVLSIFKRSKKDKGKKDKNAETESITSNKSSAEYSRDSPIPSKSSAKSSMEYVRDEPKAANKLQKQTQPIAATANGLRPLQLGQERSRVNGIEHGPGSPRGVMDGGPVRSPAVKPSPLQVIKQQNMPSYEYDAQAQDRLSESPVEVSPSDAQPDGSGLPELVRDTSSTDSDGVRSLRDSPSPQIQQLQNLQAPRAGNDGLLLSTGAAAGLSGSTNVSPISPVHRGQPGPSPQLQQHSVFPAQPARAAPTQPPPALFSQHSPRSAQGQSAQIQTHASSSPAGRTNSVSTTATLSTLTTNTAPSPGANFVWSDASLRAYFDDPLPSHAGASSSTSGSPQVGIVTTGGSYSGGCAAHDVRDLLVLTRDTSGVVPVGPDHPLMKGLFSEERGRMKEANDMLDSLLGGYLERRGRLSQVGLR
jgi:hypothetical protein